MSPEAIDAYLAHRYVPAPRTIFANIARLPNAHRLEYELDTGRLSEHRYWSPRPAPAQSCGALLDEAIELRLVADRPLGLFLSGGIDSGTIACRLAATGHAGLHSFSAAFPGSALDESAEAAATAEALRLPNERIVVPTTIRDDFARIVAALDEPFADPSSFPTWYLARATERHVKVVLGGDGGDELFGGYKRVAKHLRNGWRGALRLPLPVLPDARPKGWRKIAGELALDWESAYALRFSGLTPNQRRFLQPSLASLPAHYWRAPDLAPATPQDRLLRWDFANYLPEYVLRKADLCTMAHGLELRAPLLDHRFVEAVLALPRARALHDAAEAVSRHAGARAGTIGRVRPEEARLQPAARRLVEGRLEGSPAGGRAVARAPHRRPARRCARASDDRRVCDDGRARRADPVARRFSTKACGSWRRKRRMAGSRAPMRIASVALAILRWGWGRRRPATPRRILVLHRLLLGDTLMVTALLAKLRARFPAADIVMTVAPAYAPLYAGRPYGVTALPLDPRDIGTFWPLLFAPRFDLAILPADNRWSWLARAIGARWIVGIAGDRPAHKNWPVDELVPYSTTPTAYGDTAAELVPGPPPAPYRTDDWPPPPNDGSRRLERPLCGAARRARARHSSCGPPTVGARWPRRSRRRA